MWSTRTFDQLGEHKHQEENGQHNANCDAHLSAAGLAVSHIVREVLAIVEYSIVYSTATVVCPLCDLLPLPITALEPFDPGGFRPVEEAIQRNDAHPMPLEILGHHGSSGGINSDIDAEVLNPSNRALGHDDAIT